MAAACKKFHILRRSLLIRLSETGKTVSYVLMYRPTSCHISTFERATTVGMYDKTLTGASCKLHVLRTFKLGIAPQLHNPYIISNTTRGDGRAEKEICACRLWSNLPNVSESYCRSIPQVSADFRCLKQAHTGWAPKLSKFNSKKRIEQAAAFASVIFLECGWCNQRKPKSTRISSYCFSRKQQKIFLKHRSLWRHAFFVLLALLRLYQLKGSFDSVGVR